MKIILNQEVIDWMEKTQSVYTDDNGQKTYLALAVFRVDKDNKQVLEPLDLNHIPLFVKERICSMIGVEISTKK